MIVVSIARFALSTSLTVALCAGLSSAEAPRSAGAFRGKALPSLERRLAEIPEGARLKAWVMFRRDKGVRSRTELSGALEQLHRTFDAHAVNRRQRLRTRPGLFDVDDIPLPEAWIDAVRATGAELVVESRWVHAVSVRATRTQLARLARLEFVERLRPVARVDRPRPAHDIDRAIEDAPATARGIAGAFYGESFDQIKQLNLHNLHALGFTGAGVRIGVLDTGFRTTHEAFNDPAHPLDVVAEWDFVDNDAETGPQSGDAANQHNHGTLVLGTLAAYQPGVLVGAAYDASYILAKVEDVTVEVTAEEDLFVAGLEFIEAHGGDVATSSLVINGVYSPAELDGETTIMTQGINVATANGMHVCQGAGNSGHDINPLTSTLVPPADALRVITAGAVDVTGNIASFSSDGPTADGRLKPEVLARGVNARTVSASADSGVVGADGTSFATPLTAGATACVAQAHPDWTVDQMRTNLFLTAAHYRDTGAPDSFNVLGFGILDVVAASAGDCNDNGTADTDDLDDLVSGDCNGNAIPDECDVAALTSADDAVDGLPDECTECEIGPGCPAEASQLLLTKSHPDVVLSWQAAAGSTGHTVRRDETPAAAGATEVAQVPGSTWADPDALVTSPGPAFYLVRGLTAGGVAGP
ncbi:MAG: S8 family serine peptidase [bacterium]|nr:S8 family serine peptidase [bacterium]